MNEWKHFSPSSVSKFRGCNRDWWWLYIYGVAKVESAGQREGKAFHAMVEDYMLTLTENPHPVLRPTFEAGILPYPGEALVELPIGEDKRYKPGEEAPRWHLDTGSGGWQVMKPSEAATRPSLVDLFPTDTWLDVDGFPLVGFIDMLQITEGHPVVLDHKFLKSMRYAKTDEELGNDPQMIVYGKAAVIAHEAVYGAKPPAVTCGHLSYPKLPPYTTPRVNKYTFTIEELEAGWLGIQDTVRKMRAVALETTPDRVTPTKGQCSAFGGCQHLDRCSQLEGLTKTGGMFAGIKSVPVPVHTPHPSEVPLPDAPSGAAGLLLRARGGAAAVVQPTTVATPNVPAVAPAGAGASRASLLAALKGGAAAPAAAAVKPTGVVPGDAPTPGINRAVVRAAAPAATPAVAPAAVAEPLPAGVQLIELPPAMRKVQGYAEKLTALGWPMERHAAMTPGVVKYIIEAGCTPDAFGLFNGGAGLYAFAKGVPRPDVSEGIPPLDSQEAWDMGLALGWSATDIETMSEEVLEAILTGGLTEADHVLVRDADQLPVDIEAKPAPVVAPVAAVATVRRGPKATPAAAPAAPVASVPSGNTDLNPEDLAEFCDKERGPLFLLIDCRPSKGDGWVDEAKNLEDYLAPIARRAAAVMGVTHYGAKPYNEGAIMITAAVTLSPPTGIIVVNSRLPLSTFVLEALLPIAALVIRDSY